jgi:predicted PurR-regulated permease PerM
MTIHESPRRPGWQTGDVVRTAALIIAVYAAAKFFMMAHVLFFLTFLGVLFGLAVSAGVAWLRRWRIPDGVGAGLIVASFIGLLAGFVIWTGPTVRSQYAEIRERLPVAFVKLDRWVAQRQDGLLGSLISDESATETKPDTPATKPGTAPSGAPSTARPGTGPIVNPADTDSLSHLRSLGNSLMSKIGGGAGQYVLPVIGSTFAAFSGIVVLIFLAVYIGASAETYRRGMLSLIPHRSRARWEQVLAAVSKALRRWLVTQLIAMLAIGAVTTAVLFALGVRAALPLGILAGLLEFIPTVGPILSAVPAILMAFVDSPEKAAAVTIAYIGIQFLENHVLIPLLMKEGVDLPPVLTILTQAAMALVFGFMGLFVAVPVLVLVMILVKMLYVEDVVGEGAELPYTEQPPPAPR